MKNITEYIKESFNKSNKKIETYVKLKDLKNDEQYILCRFDDNYDLFPYKAKFMKHGNDYIFVNPDDDRELIEIDAFLWQDRPDPEIAVFDTMKDAEDFCRRCNRHNSKR